MSAIIIGIPITERNAVMGPPPKPNREEFPYQGTINFQGILVYIENVPGSLRSGRDSNGQPWVMQMKNFYGEIPGTSGSDGDPVDVYIGDNPSAPTAYILHQRHYFGTEHEVSGAYDEDKVMLGFSTKDEAMAAYAAHFNHPIWTPGCTVMSVDEMKQRIEDGELELGAALVKARTRKYISRTGTPGNYKYVYAEDLKPKKAKLAVPVDKPKRQPPGSQLDPADLARLKELGVSKLPEAAIPLSHIEVKLDPAQGIHQRAVISWKDRAGRRQNAYTPQFHEASAKKKWERVMRFRDKAPRLISGFQKGLKAAEHGSLRHQGFLIAMIVAKTGLRPGSEMSLRSTGHRGVSTLNADDITIKGNTVTFSFIGKSGKRNTATIRSNKVVAQAMQRYSEGGGRLFSSQAVLAARTLLPKGMKLKDFRTIIATNEAMKALDEVALPPPLSGNTTKDRRMVRRAIKEASTKVAARLNNTPAVAQASYIHPVIFATWIAEKVGAAPDLWK